MPGRFQWNKFADVDLQDPFFDSLKADYDEFPEWFKKKANSGESALVFKDEQGIGSFVYLKKEKEPIELADKTLPAVARMGGYFCMISKEPEYPDSVM